MSEVSSSGKDPLLFLCHRIPFPPNKGDKITTFNLLKYLSKRYTVYLGTFIDDAYDKQYISELEKYCESSFIVDITQKKQLSSGLNALLAGETVTVQHFKSNEMQAWVDNTIAEKHIHKIFVYASSLLQFVDQSIYKEKVRIVDMADIDSDKWRQYAERKPWYSKWIYSREHRKLHQLEQQALADFDAVTFITDEESALFRSISPKQFHHKVVTLSNGVDTDYFNPNAEFDLSDLPQLKTPSICFTGAMDYWANVDAVVWFCKEVWPKILAENSECVFYIVGGNPPETVKNLASLTGIVVTGRVPDVRPYIANSVLAVAPMRIARGVQNKVLEAMAMAKPVVMTTMGQEGIAMNNEQIELVLDDPSAMAMQINTLLAQPEQDYTANREWIIQRYSWDGALQKLPLLLSKENTDKQNLGT